jgi:hypothetical protein
MWTCNSALGIPSMNVERLSILDPPEPCGEV